MSDTNSNAYRTEAQEKRTQVIRLEAEARDLEAKADELDGITHGISEPAEPEETPKSGLFSKKQVPDLETSDDAIAKS